MNKVWQPGDVVVHRYVGHENWITWGFPHIVVFDPDFSWFWKDEENLAKCTELGVFTPQEFNDFYAEGHRAIQAIEQREPPFCDPWPEWRPDPAWPIPHCPQGWESLPGAFIDLNRKVYRPFRNRLGRKRE